MLSLKEQSSVQSRIWSRVRSHARKNAIEEECFKQLHSIKGRKATHLVRTQRRFNLVVRLIANECLLGCILLFILPMTLDFRHRLHYCFHYLTDLFTL